MTAGVARALLVALLTVAATLPVAAQNPSALVDRGVQAYNDLDLATAAGLLRRALESSGEIAPATRERALTYLGATEFVRGNLDSSRAAFRRLIELDPRSTLDPLVFPPELASLFAGVKLQTPVVAAVLPDSVSFKAGDGRLTARLYASTYQHIRASVRTIDGSEFRLVFGGAISDSLEVEWDGLDASGAPPRSGRYYLAIESLDLDSTAVRIVRVPLDVTALPVDTLLHPSPPADSLLMAERSSGGRAVESLVGGLLSGVGIALLPSALAPDASLSPGRVVVGGSVSLLGVIGYFTQRKGRLIPANVAANERIRAAWRARVAEVERENAARSASPILEVRAGSPTVVTRGT